MNIKVRKKFIRNIILSRIDLQFTFCLKTIIHLCHSNYRVVLIIKRTKGTAINQPTGIYAHWNKIAEREFLPWSLNYSVVIQIKIESYHKDNLLKILELFMCYQSGSSSEVLSFPRLLEFECGSGLLSNERIYSFKTTHFDMVLNAQIQSNVF